MSPESFLVLELGTLAKKYFRAENQEVHDLGISQLKDVPTFLFVLHKSPIHKICTNKVNILNALTASFLFLYVNYQ